MNAIRKFARMLAMFLLLVIALPTLIMMEWLSKIVWPDKWNEWNQVNEEV